MLLDYTIDTTVVSKQFVTTLLQYFSFFNFEPNIHQLMFVLQSDEVKDLITVYFILKHERKKNEYKQQRVLMQVQMNEYRPDDILRFIYFDSKGLRDNRYIEEFNTKLQRITKSNIDYERIMSLVGQDLYIDLTYFIGVTNFTFMEDYQFVFNQQHFLILEKLHELFMKIVTNGYTIVSVLHQNMKNENVYYSVVLSKLKYICDNFGSMLLSSFYKMFDDENFRKRQIHYVTDLSVNLEHLYKLYMNFMSRGQ